MNNDVLRQALTSSAETRVGVSDELHQRIMRSVRLTTASETSGQTRWSLPAWGIGMAATAMAVLYLAQITPQTIVTPDIPVADSTATPIDKMLSGLQIETVLPEQELRKELERLKSDLKRFDFRS